MHFNPLFAAVAGILVIAAIPALVKDRGHSGGENREAQHQERNPTIPAASVNSPASERGTHGAYCPGTGQSEFDCNTISAIANVRQADAAERFNRLAIFEIFVGFVTAIVAGLAAAFAKQAADAARQNLSHDKAQAKATLRPWLGAKTIEQVRVLNTTMNNVHHANSLGFQVVITNSGSSPAVDAITKMSLRTLPTGEPVPPPETTDEESPAAVVLTSEPLKFLPMAMTDEETSAFRAQERYALIYFEISYRSPHDRLGKQHRTRIYYQAHHGGGTLNDMEAIFFRIVPDYNDMQ